MLGKAVLFLLLAASLIAAEELPRKGAKAQRQLAVDFVPLRLCVQKNSFEARDLSIEVFQVLELPLVVHEASMLRSDKGYLLKLSLANTSELKIIGLRYSLATINSESQAQIRVNRTEGFSIPAYATKSLTFKTPIKFKLRDGERLVLMLEQVVSRESIWEVVKAKEAFEAYARGDYSVMPVVMRVANQVDSPPPGRLPKEK